MVIPAAEPETWEESQAARYEVAQERRDARG